MEGRRFEAYTPNGQKVGTLLLGAVGVQIEEQCISTLYFEWAEYGDFCRNYLSVTEWSRDQVRHVADVFRQLMVNPGVEELARRSVEDVGHWGIAAERFREVWTQFAQFFNEAASREAAVRSEEVGTDMNLIVQLQLSAAAQDVDLTDRHDEPFGKEHDDWSVIAQCSHGFGKRAATARKLRGLSLGDVTSRVGLAGSDLIRLEKGYRITIPYETVQKLAVTLSVSALYLLRGELDRKSQTRLKHLGQTVQVKLPEFWATVKYVETGGFNRSRRYVTRRDDDEMALQVGRLSKR